MGDNDSFRLVPAEIKDKFCFYVMLVLAAVGYAWGGY